MPTSKPARKKNADLDRRRAPSAPEPAEVSRDAPLRSGPASLRPDPATLFTRTSVATVGLAMIFAADAAAQAPSTTPPPKRPAAGDTTEMPEVVVRGTQEEAGSYRATTASNPQYTQPLRDTPQSITVVPQAVIQQQAASSLRDVLRNVPGISMQAGEGGGGPSGDFLSVRGFSARNDIFIDGVRDFGGYTRDPFNFESVEVAKGPASSYTGRGSTGGSINLTSKHAGLESSFYNATLGMGTDEFKRVTADINQVLTPIWGSGRTPATELTGAGDGKGTLQPIVPPPSDFRAALRVNGLWQENEVANRNFVENKRWGIAPTLTLAYGENTKLSLSYFHLQQDNLPDYGIPWVPNTQLVLGPKYYNKPSPVDFSNYYGLAGRDKEEIVTDIGTLEFEQKFNDSFSIRNALRYGQTNRDSITTAPRYNESLDPDFVINRQFQARDQTDTILAEQFDARFSFATFGVKHDLVTGFDFAHETAENKLRAAPLVSVTSLYHPNPSDSYGGPIEYTGAKNKSETDSLGLFLSDTLKFGEHWQLSGGVRWDYYDAELEQRTVEGLVNNFSRTDKVWSYRVALAYKPVEIGTIYVAYGTSFNPSAEGAVSTNLLTEGSASLKPEKNRTIELGTKWEVLDRRLALTAAVFQTDKTDARVPGLPGEADTVLGGEQRVRGFEVGVAGSITEHWKVFGGYTYLDSEVRKTTDTFADPFTGEIRSRRGRELPQTPEHSFSLWTTYSLPWDIEIGAGTQYVGSRFSTTDNLREAPDYWLVDAMISKQITKNVKAQINVYNLADEEYIDRVGGGHFIPGAGRTGVLTIGVNF
jgi:catecholate siderophore receptor